MPPFTTVSGAAAQRSGESVQAAAQRQQCAVMANLTDTIKRERSERELARVFVVPAEWNSNACREHGLARANELVLELMWDHLEPPPDAFPQRPRQLMVPVLSHVRWSGALAQQGATPPWQRWRDARPVLMSYVGSAMPQGDDLSRGTMPTARRMINQQCAALAAPSACTAMIFRPTGSWMPPDHWTQQQADGLAPPGDGRDSLVAALGLKQRALFCLEPPGANPIRRSMYDSLLSGCIPVLFMSADEHRRFLPPPFFERRHNMTVRIDPAELSSTLDLHARLAHINASGRALRMRKAIARHAHRLVYSLDAGYRGDAADAFVEALLMRVDSVDAARDAAEQAGHGR